MALFDGITRQEWNRWEETERRFRDHPKLFRFQLGALFAEGVLVWLLLLGVIVWLVQLCIAQPGRCFFLICILVGNFLVMGKNCLSLSSRRFGSGLPVLSEADWPQLHALVREIAAVAGAPKIHRVFLAPDTFNASALASFPLLPGIRRNMLILGYPLLAALSSRGLRGLLAHELDHVAHHDGILVNALFHILSFLGSLEIDLFTWMLGPWRRSYLNRLNRLLSPLRRERELAADRAIVERFGLGTLREMLVTTRLHQCLLDVEYNGTSPARQIRASVRRDLSVEQTRRCLDRILRSIVPPMAEHPPLAARAGTTDVADLLPYANAPQDALETLFGAADALDAIVDGALVPVLEENAENARRERAHLEARLARLPADTADPDAIIERISILRSLGRKDEAGKLLRGGRALHPDNAALEAIELGDALENADTAEDGAPLARRLEELIGAEPLLRIWAEDQLFSHYLEIGDNDRIKGLLDLRQHGEQALRLRLAARLRPTDDLRAMPLSETDREVMLAVFDGRQVREVYPVQRLYKGTGTSSSFFVVRWRELADSTRLAAYESVFPTISVVAGTRSLFRRFAELGILPVPIPRKAAGRKGKHSPEDGKGAPRAP